jgi:hypothetical protein
MAIGMDGMEERLTQRQDRLEIQEIDIELRENKEWLRRYMFSVPVVHWEERISKFPDIPIGEIRQALIRWKP